MPLTAFGQGSEASTTGPASRKVSPRGTYKIGSDCIKRTYQQITRSQSRSVTPTPPSKRRRTSVRNASPSPSFTSASSFSQPSSPVQRFAGDGLDHRRPTTAAMAQIQPQEQDTIDLTLSDDDNHIAVSGRTTRAPSGTGSNISARNLRTSRRSRPPRRGQPQQINPDHGLEVIELSSEDEDDGIQITGFRQLTRGSAPSSQTNAPRPLSTPPAELRRADAQTFGLAGTAAELRNHLGNIGAYIGQRTAGLLPFPRAALPVALDHHIHHGMHHGIPPDIDLATFDSVGDMDDYDLQLDYAQAGFDMVDVDADEVEEIKQPAPAARKGFTRDLEENGDVLVCVACEDELNGGGDDVKQQVWASKKCGHVRLNLVQLSFANYV